MFEELLNSFAYFRFWLLLFISLICGLGVAGHTRNVVAHILWSIPYGIFIMVMVVTSEFMDFRRFANSTGAYSSHDEAGFTVAGFHMLAFWLFIYLGVKVSDFQMREREQKANAMTAEDFVKELNVIAAHPDMAKSGWFADRWSVLGPDERHHWVEKNLTSLRTLIVEHDEGSLQAYGTGLTTKLAVIENYGDGIGNE